MSIIHLLTVTPSILEQLPAAVKERYDLKPGAPLLISVCKEKRTIIIRPAELTALLAEQISSLFDECLEIRRHLYQYQFQRRKETRNSTLSASSHRRCIRH
ncbi:hypothetical protein ACP3TJ_12270 [Desulforudis sp. 1088]|uniref:hypothetical protein n=1 Tax=unclassified Candidatus Desulforudis TaxID=2635950 RepID=UPI003CE51B9D